MIIALYIFKELTFFWPGLDFDKEIGKAKK